MPSDLGAYLAANYLTADPKSSSSKPKKRRRKNEGQDPSAGLLITDDDESGWGAGGHGASKGEHDGDENDPAMVAGVSAEFRRKKKTGWKTLGGGGTDATGAVDAVSGPKKAANSTADDSSAADAILASAAAEKAAAAADEDQPMVDTHGGGDDNDTIKMSDGTHAGLQSAAAVSAQLKRRADQERADFERDRAARRKRRRENGGKDRGDDEEEEAVFRDATGRRIDLSMRRAEARQELQIAEEKERQAKQALKGEVQIKEAVKRRENLEDAALLGVARYKDDEAMNKEMKEAARWNDPMAEFLSANNPTTQTGGDLSTGVSKKGKKKDGMKAPQYTGPAAPNRYGIRPGYRWDGVDRGNGFEAERFKALNRRERNKGLEYSWQMDE